MNPVRMKVALHSRRNVIHSLPCGMIECERNEVRKVTRDEEPHLARRKSMVPHASFI